MSSGFESRFLHHFTGRVALACSGDSKPSRPGSKPGCPATAVVAKSWRSRVRFPEHDHPSSRCTSAARLLASGARGRWFESIHLDHFIGIRCYGRILVWGTSCPGSTPGFPTTSTLAGVSGIACRALNPCGLGSNPRRATTCRQTARAGLPTALLVSVAEGRRGRLQPGQRGFDSRR